MLSQYWTVQTDHPSVDPIAFVVRSVKRPNELRLAYRLTGMSRWQLSSIISASLAKTWLDCLREDQLNGHGPQRFLHSVRTHRRMSVKGRFQIHRAELARRREINEIKNLPTFGMF